MILLGTTTSPYVRIVRVAIRDRGLLPRIEERVVITRVPHSPVLEYNPTGKVPTLVTDYGSVLSETRHICRYLDSLHSGDPIVPTPKALEARALEGLATGFLDGVAVLVREMRRPDNERSPGIIEQERARAGRCLEYFEARSELLTDRVDYTMLALATAVAFLAYGDPDFDWAAARPRVEEWMARYRDTPAMRATRPRPGDLAAAGD